MRGLPVSVRAAVADDFDAMDALATAAARAQCSTAYSPEILDAWVGTPYPQRFVEGESRGSCHYVATQGGEIVAYGGIDVRGARIEGLFVAPDRHGMGLGAIMLACLLRHARLIRLPEVTVESSLNAVDFYVRHGFHEFARQPIVVREKVTMEAVMLRARVGGWV
ncbi:MAG TPA: GNAT family N-acetyltransferase [Burkholderiaceae bacterium]